MTRSDAVPMLVLLSRRESISSTDFGTFWQDVHGPLAARLPGLHHYRQLHLESARGWWPEQPSVDAQVSAADRIDAVAEMGFLTRDGQKQYAAVGHHTRNDEVNLFRRSVRYLGDQATADAYEKRTALMAAEDRDSPSAARSSAHPSVPLRLFGLFRRRPEVAPVDFAATLGQVAAALAESGSSTGNDAPTQGAVWTFVERDNTQNHLLSAGVDHDTPPERQYHAAIEMAFADAMAARRCFESAGFQATLEAQAGHLAAAHVYRIWQVAPMLLGGRMTLSGLRGHSVAQLIRKVGATNQVGGGIPEMFADAASYRYDAEGGTR